MELGERWGCEAAPGWVIGLEGDLGAGKTQLVRGLARGLGFNGRIQSPTFALVNEYAGGRMPLHHLDLYRLENQDQIVAAGLEVYFEPEDGITVVEWAERWEGPLPARFRRVRFEIVSDSERRIAYEDCCP